MLRSLLIPAAATLLSACITTRPPLVMPDRVLGPRDSLALAFETGRRDAMVLHPERIPLAALVPAAGLLIALQTNEWWTFPVTSTVTSAGVTLWAYGATKAPLPAPPDSMRGRYALESEESWHRYRLGFESVIEERRARYLSASFRGWILTGGLWLLYFAYRPPR